MVPGLPVWGDGALALLYMLISTGDAIKHKGVEKHSLPLLNLTTRTQLAQGNPARHAAAGTCVRLGLYRLAVIFRRARVPAAPSTYTVTGILPGVSSATAKLDPDQKLQ